MPWITVDTHLPDHPKMAELPTDSARWAWIVVLTKAKLQRQAGRFASERHFKEVMGRHGRHLASFKDCDLLEQDGNALVVHDWDRHQWRAAKERQREDNGETNEGQEKDSRAGNAVTVPVSVNPTVGEEGVQGETGPDALNAYYSLTGRFPTGNVRSWLDGLAQTYGTEAVERALSTEAIADSSPKTLISRAENRLALEAHEAEKKRQDAARKAAEAERQKIEEMPLEQRTANRERLAQMMVDAGLHGPERETKTA